MERNLVAAIIYYGADWLLRPATAILGVVAIFVLVNSIVQEHRRARQKAYTVGSSGPHEGAAPFVRRERSRPRLSVLRARVNFPGTAA